MRKYITKKEINKAERILNNLERIVRISVESEFACSVKGHGNGYEESHFDRLMGGLDMLVTLKVISFDDMMLLTKYFINKRHEEEEKAA